MKKTLIIPALALAALALVGCGTSAAKQPPAPSTQDGPSVGIGEAPPAKGSPFSPTEADIEAVEATWATIAGACDRVDVAKLKAADDTFVCDPRGRYEVISGKLDGIEFSDEWSADGYVAWGTFGGSKPVSGPNLYEEGDTALPLSGSLHVPSGTVTMIPNDM